MILKIVFYIKKKGATNKNFSKYKNHPQDFPQARVFLLVVFYFTFCNRKSAEKRHLFQVRLCR
jgi:hypothetical protein